MRHHGWELPYHPLQIVAVAVFFALVFDFYVFIVPFTGSRRLEILTIAAYSPTIVVVFVVYFWCVATNPADVGVRISKKRLPSASSETSSRTAGAETEETTEPKADKYLSPLHSENQNAGAVAAGNSSSKLSLSFSFAHVLLSGIASLFQICTHNSSAQPPSTEDGMLYCSLCKVGIFRYSKHCRVCDKCVDGFDHHCRWLNNCVGRKNYAGFVVLMVSGIMMLILQWSIGLWVMVHFFLNLNHFKNVIASKLGSSFSFIAYIIVVALCTLLAMVATYPLAQLFCFHMLLMKKGISTYDYVIAMKEQQKLWGESAHSPLTSPASSIATAKSSASSSGILQGRAWCTPPRLFFDHEQAIFSPESCHLRKDIDEGLFAKVVSGENQKKKTSVRLSPWALASLKKEDVLQAATIARNKSSILHPVVPNTEKQVMAEASSSCNNSKDMIAEFLPPLETRHAAREVTDPNLNCTDQSFVVSSWQNGKLPLGTLEQQVGTGRNSGNTNKHAEKGKKMLNPMQVEARNAFKTSREFSISGNPVSSPGSSGTSSEAQLDMLELPHPSIVPTDLRWIENEYDGSGCDSTDDSDWIKSLPHALNKEKKFSDAHQGSLQYSPGRKVLGAEISTGTSTFIPRTGDENDKTSVVSNDDGADEHLNRMATTNDFPSQKGSRERTRISKYMITDPHL